MSVTAQTVICLECIINLRSLRCSSPPRYRRSLLTCVTSDLFVSVEQRRLAGTPIGPREIIFTILCCRGEELQRTAIRSCVAED